MEEYLRLQGWQPILFFSVLFTMGLGETLAPLIPNQHRLQHARRNMAMTGINAIVNLGLRGGVAAAALFAERMGFGLLHWIDVDRWVEALIGVLVLDLGNYTIHRIKHRVPLLWRFHQVHHSDPILDVTTSARFHPGETLISIIFEAMLVLAFGIPLWVLPLYLLMLTTVIQINHANVRIPVTIDRRLRKFVVSPYMHKLHHSRDRFENDSNFSDVFPFWDKLMGTYRERGSYFDLKTGLKEYDDLPLTVREMLRIPFRDNFKSK